MAAWKWNLSLDAVWIPEVFTNRFDNLYFDEGFFWQGAVWDGDEKLYRKIPYIYGTRMIRLWNSENEWKIVNYDTVKRIYLTQHKTE
jgi:hypothetical protein